jgi:molecular chaperone GrpE
MKRTNNKEEESKKINHGDDNLSINDSDQDLNSEKSADEISCSDDLSEKDKQQINDQQMNVETEDTKVEPDYESIIAEWKDKYIRLSAEFDNYRKRTLKEKIELSKYGSEEVLKSLLPVVDDLERGLKTLEQATDMTALKEGIDLIYSKFVDFLKQKGLKEIEAINCDFNTDLHEAVTKIPAENKEMSGKVVDVIQKGYLLDEKVIRYAKVVVGE